TVTVSTWSEGLNEQTTPAEAGVARTGTTTAATTATVAAHRTTARPLPGRAIARVDPSSTGLVKQDSARFGQGFVERNQAGLESDDRGLGPVGEAELGEDARDVALHGLLADRERLGDLPVRTPPGDLLEHVDLALRERREGAGRPLADLL